MAMSEKTENLLVKLLNLAVGVVTAWTLLSVDYTGRGSIISQLRGEQPSAADRSALAAPGKANLQRAEGRDRSLIVPEENQIAAAPEAGRTVTAAELAAQVPASAAAQPAAKSKSFRLKSSLTGLDDPSRRASQKTSAGLSPTPAYIEASAVAAPSPAGTVYSNEPPAEEAKPQRRAVASRYNAVGRSDMMGNSGGGPVYNIKAKD
jgi:hypothetical protein